MRTGNLRLRRWLRVSVAAAVVVTAVDAVLLERSKGFFRGGFLSSDFLEGPGQTALFLAVSLLVDAAFIGAAVALVARGLSWTRLRAPARLLAGVLAGAGLLLAYDAASYQILRFLGDAFDLQLFLDLLDGKWSEILAVSWVQLVAALAVAVAVCAVAGGLVWGVHRYADRDSATGRDPVLVPLLAAGAGVLALAVAATSSDVLENGLLRKPAGQAFAAVANWITDVDRDGYGIVGRASDPAPFDGSVFPYAVEVPGNGVDEDGVAGDLPAATTAFADAPMPAAPWARTPDVVLVVLESFRADLVGAHFEGKPITPVMNALGARGYSSPSAYSHNGYTIQSRFHIFTGTLAGAPGSRSLIDDFKAHGYQVAYFSGQDESFGGPQYAIGFARADASSDARNDKTKRYMTSSTPGSLAVPLSVVEGHVTHFLAHGASDKPLLLCINLYDTHFPYTHAGIETLTSSTRLPREEIVPGEHDRLWATYANTAANVDRAIGTVIEAVRAARGREPGIVVTSDHGESLFDEGFLGHGYALNEAQTRVPFIVANLPMVLPEPMAQSDLRRALLTAMSAPDGPPRSTPRDDRPIFQYLGDLARPKQVAFLEAGGRFVYDFRSARARSARGSWQSPRDLPQPEQAEFRSLVRFWERIQMARRPVWRKTNDAN